MNTERLSPAEFTAAAKRPLRFVLDNIRSGLNTGSVFRTADAFLLDGLDLCGITVQPPHRDVLKTALGASAHVHWRHFDSTLAAIESLRADGWKIAVLEQADQTVSLEDWNPRAQKQERWAVILGNEVRGCSAEVIASADVVLEIPQRGVKQSMNVSVCAGIVAWQALI
jgi:23S rRNA (guanosine2251-2'-O)-methyltransferase